jgi:hypothetical protein
MLSDSACVASRLASSGSAKKNNHDNTGNQDNLHKTFLWIQA